MWIEINVDLWRWILSQVIGLVSIVLIFIAFQAKTKSKVLLLQTLAISLGVVGTALLENFVVMGLLAVTIVRNMVFIWLDKNEEKVSKFVSYAALVFFMVAMVIVVVVTRSWWYDWMLLVVSLISVYGKWAKGIHRIRITSLIFSVAIIPNQIAFANLMGLVIDAIIISSIFMFYVKYFKKKAEAEAVAVLEQAPSQPLH